PAPDPVAAVATRRRLDRDVGLAQDRHVPARGPVGDAQPAPELGGRDARGVLDRGERAERPRGRAVAVEPHTRKPNVRTLPARRTDRKSTRLNSSHVKISYAVFCLKKKKK